MTSENATAEARYVPLGSVITIENRNEFPEPLRGIGVTIPRQDSLGQKYVVTGYQDWNPGAARGTKHIRLSVLIEETFDQMSDGKVYRPDTDGKYRYIILDDLRAVKVQVVGRKPVASSPEFEMLAIGRANVRTAQHADSIKVRNVELRRANGKDASYLESQRFYKKGEGYRNIAFGEVLSSTPARSLYPISADRFKLTVTGGANGPA